MRLQTQHVGGYSAAMVSRTKPFCNFLASERCHSIEGESYCTGEEHSVFLLVAQTREQWKAFILLRILKLNYVFFISDDLEKISIFFSSQMT